MPQIRPITDLRNTTEISDLCHARREPVFITKNGYGDLVVMSIETYEAMTETAAVDAAISQAEAEYAQTGELYDAHEALSSLRRKHFGTVQRLVAFPRPARFRQYLHLCCPDTGRTRNRANPHWAVRGCDLLSGDIPPPLSGTA